VLTRWKRNCARQFRTSSWSASRYPTTHRAWSSTRRPWWIGLSAWLVIIPSPRTLLRTGCRRTSSKNKRRKCRSRIRSPWRSTNLDSYLMRKKARWYQRSPHYKRRSFNCSRHSIWWRKRQRTSIMKAHLTKSSPKSTKVFVNWRCETIWVDWWRRMLHRA
jgi:hypothetical protein